MLINSAQSIFWLFSSNVSIITFFYNARNKPKPLKLYFRTLVSYFLLEKVLWQTAGMPHNKTILLLWKYLLFVSILVSYCIFKLRIFCHLCQFEKHMHANVQQHLINKAMCFSGLRMPPTVIQQLKQQYVKLEIQVLMLALLIFHSC